MKSRLLVAMLLTAVLVVTGRGLADPAERNPPRQDTAQARIGFWRTPSFASAVGASSGLSQAQTKTIHDKLRAISDVLRENPVLGATVGFEAQAKHATGVSVGIRAKHAEMLPASTVEIFLFDYLQTCDTCPIKPVEESRGILRLGINAPDAFYDSWKQPFATDAEGPIYLEPARIGEFGGFPVYAPAGYPPRILLTNLNARPLWLPVSQERVIRGRIASLQQEAQKMKPPYDRPRRETIAALETELAALSPAELAAQAFVASGRSTRSSGLARGTDRGARGLVATNPTYFDLTRGKTSFQMAVVSTYPADLITRPSGWYAAKTLLEAMKTTDWKKIAGMLQ